MLAQCREKDPFRWDPAIDAVRLRMMCCVNRIGDAEGIGTDPVLVVERTRWDLSSTWFGIGRVSIRRIMIVMMMITVVVWQNNVQGSSMHFDLMTFPVGMWLMNGKL